jgi:trehalose 6-phosphate phosphatase
LDVDGTLVEIADTPADAAVAGATRSLLSRLSDALEGAVALVSGRRIAELDRLFAPLRLAAAGVHGLERRPVGGTPFRAVVPRAAEFAAAVARISAFARATPGVLVEDKKLSVAVHYRQAAQRREGIRRFMQQQVESLGPDFCLQEGKQVIELRPEGSGKGAVVEAFMKEPPFRGRIPVFIGDDVTDEDGFAAVNRLEGYSIRVGDGAPTGARWRLPTVPALLRWLEDVAGQLAT